MHHLASNVFDDQTLMISAMACMDTHAGVHLYGAGKRLACLFSMTTQSTKEIIKTFEQGLFNLYQVSVASNKSSWHSARASLKAEGVHRARNGYSVAAAGRCLSALVINTLRAGSSCAFVRTLLPSLTHSSLQAYHYDAVSIVDLYDLGERTLGWQGWILNES